MIIFCIWAPCRIFLSLSRQTFIRYRVPVPILSYIIRHPYPYIIHHLRPTSKQFTTGNACGNIVLPTPPSYNQSRGRRKQDFSSCLRLVVVRKYSSKTQRDQGRQHKPSNQWRENGHLRNVIIFFDRDKSTKQHQRRQQTTPNCIGGTERSKCSAKRKVLVLWMPWFFDKSTAHCDCTHTKH